MKMTYEEALAQVLAAPQEANYLIFKLGYDLRVVVPAQEGIVMLRTLLAAEKVANTYGDPERFEPIEKNKVEINILSGAEYRHIKVCNLLGMTPTEYNDAKEKQHA